MDPRSGVASAVFKTPEAPLPSMRGLPLALLVVLAALAGCTQAPPAADVDPASDDGGEPASATPTPTAPAPSNRTERPGGNATSPNGTAAPAPRPQQPSAPSPARTWPDLDKATVRPGVQTFYGDSQCTSNFVFTSPDNQTLYLGSAAHCFGTSAKVGDAVDIGGGLAGGTLAYSSWLTMGSNGQGEALEDPAACEKEEDATVCAYNDFALVRVDEASEAVVHPAMLHFGGPTALAASGSVAMGEKVLTYGNTWLRQGLDPTNRHEGYVLAQDGWTTETYTAPQGVPGDSGSGVLLGDGRALGVLVTVAYAPVPGANGVTSLDLALQYAKEKAGLDARLATWDLLEGGLVPL